MCKLLIINRITPPRSLVPIRRTISNPFKSFQNRRLVRAVPFERAYPEVPYLRGLPFLRLQKGTEAAAEFQKILNHKGANWGSAWRYPYWGQFYSLSYLGLGRTSALAGNTAKAGKAF